MEKLNSESDENFIQRENKSEELEKLINDRVIVRRRPIYPVAFLEKFPIDPKVLKASIDGTKKHLEKAKKEMIALDENEKRLKEDQSISSSERNQHIVKNRYERETLQDQIALFEKDLTKFYRQASKLKIDVDSLHLCCGTSKLDRIQAGESREKNDVRDESAEDGFESLQTLMFTTRNEQKQLRRRKKEVAEIEKKKKVVENDQTITESERTKLLKKIENRKKALQEEIEVREESLVVSRAIASDEPLDQDTSEILVKESKKTLALLNDLATKMKKYEKRLMERNKNDPITEDVLQKHRDKMKALNETIDAYTDKLMATTGQLDDMKNDTDGTPVAVRFHDMRVPLKEPSLVIHPNDIEQMKKTLKSANEGLAKILDQEEKVKKNRTMKGRGELLKKLKNEKEIQRTRIANIEDNLKFYEETMKAKEPN